MKDRVTQADIARIAGVHNTTVSLSLRNSPLIPDTTRQRIQAIAEKLGYCPDPALRALVAYRNSLRTKRELGTIALVTNWETRWGWCDLPWFAAFHAGAQRRASDSGYQLEHFWLGEPGMSSRRLGSMLDHRGIKGVVLVAHRPGPADLSGMDWAHLAGIKVGTHPRLPQLARVAEDYCAIMRLALRQLTSLGYRRVGFAVRRAWDQGHDQAWSNAFFAEQSRLPAGSRVRVHFLSERPADAAAIWSADSADSLALGDWIETEQPDAILGLDGEVPRLLAPLGVSVPGDIAYADLALTRPDGQMAGVQSHRERIGELAIELLADQLEQNRFGPPSAPTVTSVAGLWCPGASVPAATPVRATASVVTSIQCA